MKVEIKFSEILDCLKTKYPNLTDDMVITIDRVRCFPVILSKHSDSKIYLELEKEISSIEK